MGWCHCVVCAGAAQARPTSRTTARKCPPTRSPVPLGLYHQAASAKVVVSTGWCHCVGCLPVTLARPTSRCMHLRAFGSAPNVRFGTPRTDSGRQPTRSRFHGLLGPPLLSGLHWHDFLCIVRVRLLQGNVFRNETTRTRHMRAIDTPPSILYGAHAREGGTNN